MTLRELMEAVGQQPLVLVALFLVPLVAAWIVGLVHGKGAGALGPWRWLYSILVYWVCVPGLFAAVLTAYALFFTGDNLLDVNLLVYLLPIVSMIATLVLIGRNVKFDQIPGFDRLWGMMVCLGLSFAIALAIQKTRIWVFFGATIWMLFVIAAVVFGLLMWGGRMAFGEREKS